MTSISSPENLLMSPSSVMMKALFLQNMMDFATMIYNSLYKQYINHESFHMDFAGVLLPSEFTMRYEPCSMKHFPAVSKSILWGE